MCVLSAQIDVSGPVSYSESICVFFSVQIDVSGPGSYSESICVFLVSKSTFQGLAPTVGLLGGPLCFRCDANVRSFGADFVHSLVGFKRSG